MSLHSPLHSLWWSLDCLDLTFVSVQIVYQQIMLSVTFHWHFDEASKKRLRWAKFTLSLFFGPQKGTTFELKDSNAWMCDAWNGSLIITRLQIVNELRPSESDLSHAVMFSPSIFVKSKEFKTFLKLEMFEFHTQAQVWNSKCYDLAQRCILSNC